MTVYWVIVLGFTPYRQYFSHVTAVTIREMIGYEILKCSLAALRSLLFYEIQRNGLLRAKGLLWAFKTIVKEYTFVLFLFGCVFGSSGV